MGQNHAIYLLSINMPSPNMEGNGEENLQVFLNKHEFEQLYFIESYKTHYGFSYYIQIII
jgi:hypothetical protein